MKRALKSTEQIFFLLYVAFGVKNFIVFYQEIEGGIDVIRILHGSRNIDAELGFEK